MDDKSKKKILKFLKHYEVKSYRKGEVIINPEKNPSGVFCLKKGVVRCFAISKKGDQLTINVFKAISFFPLWWVINNTSNKYFFDALTDIEVYIVPKATFLHFLQHDSDVSFDLLKRIFRGLDGYFLRMETLLSGEAYAKTVSHLLITAKRFGVKEENGLIINTSQNEIASLSGLSRESVTREIGKLKKKKLLIYENGAIRIFDLELLEKELSK